MFFCLFANIQQIWSKHEKKQGTPSAHLKKINLSQNIDEATKKPESCLNLPSEVQFQGDLSVTCQHSPQRNGLPLYQRLLQQLKPIARQYKRTRKE